MLDKQQRASKGLAPLQKLFEQTKTLNLDYTKAKIKLALCDARLSDEMEKTRPLARELTRIVYWGDGDLEALIRRLAVPGHRRRIVLRHAFAAQIH